MSAARPNEEAAAAAATTNGQAPDNTDHPRSSDDLETRLRKRAEQLAGDQCTVQDFSAAIDWIKHELERQRFAVERSFVKTYFSVMVTLVIAICGGVMSFIQWYYGEAEKRINQTAAAQAKTADQKRLEQAQAEDRRRYEQAFAFQSLQFFAEHRTEIEKDPEAGLDLKNAALRLFPAAEQQAALVNLIIDTVPGKENSKVQQELLAAEQSIPLPVPGGTASPPQGSKLACYVQYLTGYDPGLLDQVMASLKKQANWKVSPPQQVPYAPRRNDVRYYFKEDRTPAGKVVDALKSAGVTATLNERLVAKNTHRQGVIEIWLRP